MKKTLTFFMICSFCFIQGACRQAALDNNSQQENNTKAQAASSQPSDNDNRPVPASPEQQTILLLVNRERHENGLGSLCWDDELARMAEQRAREISSRFSHTRPDGSSWMILLDGYSIPWTSCGENLAQGPQDPNVVMKAWMRSSGHRANILKSAYTRLGIGVYAAPDGTLYWVQLFAA